MSTLHKKLFDARSNWYNIGLNLKLKRDELNAVEVEHRDNLDTCLRKVLTHHLQVFGALSWREVCDCLRSPTVDRNDVAEKIEEWRKDGTAS